MTAVRQNRVLIKQGWLKKKSKIIGSWRKRWTVIESRPSETYTNITNVIMLTYKTEVDYHSTEHQSKKEKRKRSSTECINLLLFPICQSFPKNTLDFQLKNIALTKRQQKSFVFRCSSVLERNEWCFAIVSNSMHTTVVNERHLKHKLIHGFINQYCTDKNSKLCSLIIPPLVIHLIKQYFVFIRNNACKQKAMFVLKNYTNT